MSQSARSAKLQIDSLPSDASESAEAASSGRRAQITLSPFYHSAANAVTEPTRFVACSQYFVARWMPLLGGEGTRIVLALRSLGYYNPKTGERRDQIVVGHAELSARVGCSEDTLTRQLALDKATGLPRNPALARFVERERRVRRDPRTGRVWQEENAYRVAMDDPIHPDDWPRVEEEVAERETHRAGGAGAPIPLKPQRKAQPPAHGARPQPGSAPKPQFAAPANSPKPQNAECRPHGAGRTPQNAAHGPQNAVPHNGNLYFPTPENPENTATLAGCFVDSETACIEGGADAASEQSLQPLRGQTGFAAFQEVAAQLRALDGKRPASRGECVARGSRKSESQEAPNHARQ